MNLKYTYNDKYSAKDNVLLYFKSKSDTWLAVGDVNKAMYNNHITSLPSVIYFAFKDDLLKRKIPHGLYEYKINDKGLEYLNRLDNCDNGNHDETRVYKKYTPNDIINFLNNSSNMWRTSTMIASAIGLNPRTHAGAVGCTLSKMYKDGGIIRKTEGGIKYYKPFRESATQTAMVNNTDESQNNTDSTEKPPSGGDQFTVVPKIATQPDDYIIMFKGRMKCLESNGMPVSVIAKMCFEALQPEFDSIVEKKKLEILENKRTDEMKYMEDHNFVFLEDQKKLQNEILDLKDRLNKKESKELNDRAMSEHVVKNGTMK